MYKPTKEIAKGIRTQLKKEFPKFKFSVTCGGGTMHSTIDVCLMQADFLPINVNGVSDYEYEDGHVQVNQYYISNSDKLNEKGRKLMQRVKEITDKDNYDNSDIMTDYFDVGFCLHLEIGKWDKPFKQVA